MSREATRHDPRADAARVLIRPAFAADGPGLARLAALDEAPVPAAPLLVAEIDGELWSAVSLISLEHVADPFRPSAELTELVLERARQVRAAPRSRRRRWWRWGSWRSPRPVRIG